jgi:chromate transport protein ChrA
LVLAGLGLIVCLLLAFVALESSTNLANHRSGLAAAVIGRLSSAVSELSSAADPSQSTLHYRSGVASDTMSYLGVNWAWGLGFLHPAARYFSNLPYGTISNSDLGGLAVIMRTGLIGLMLCLTPVVSVIVATLRLRSVPPGLAGSPSTELGLLTVTAASLTTVITLDTAFAWPPMGLLVASMVILVRETQESSASASSNAHGSMEQD